MNVNKINFQSTQFKNELHYFYCYFKKETQGSQSKQTTTTFPALTTTFNEIATLSFSKYIHI